MINDINEVSLTRELHELLITNFDKSGNAMKRSCREQQKIQQNYTSEMKTAELRGNLQKHSTNG